MGQQGDIMLVNLKCVSKIVENCHCCIFFEGCFHLIYGHMLKTQPSFNEGAFYFFILSIYGKIYTSILADFYCFLYLPGLEIYGSEYDLKRMIPCFHHPGIYCGKYLFQMQDLLFPVFPDEICSKEKITMSYRIHTYLKIIKKADVLCNIFQYLCNVWNGTQSQKSRKSYNPFLAKFSS